MELLETIDDILEQEIHILPKDSKVKTEFSFDEMLFNRMANFIINLDPDSLSEDQVQEIIDMIEELEVEFDEEGIEEIKTPRLAKRTAANKNQYSKKWYRTNKNSIKRRKAKMARSSQGRKRAIKKGRMARIGKTATGRRKVRYHRRKRSQEEK